MFKKRYQRIIGLVASLILLLGIIIPTSIISAGTTIIVTFKPAYVAISVSPDTWTINGLTGDNITSSNTVYYSNPLGDTTSPTTGGAGADDSECNFTITNTSNVVTDIKVTMSDVAGGSDTEANSDNGTNGVNYFGAKSYFSGQTSGQWVVVKASGSDVGKASLGATTNIKFGLRIQTQSNDYTGSSDSTATITVTATKH